MPGLSYSIDVVSPCTGEQLVNKVETYLYAGSGGDFAYAILTKPANEDAWQFTIYDYSSSPCSPTKTYNQVTANANDPKGSYTCPSGGEADVNEWP